MLMHHSAIMKTLLLLLALVSGLLHADPMLLTSTATFDGTSTLHDFTGTGISEAQAAEWTPTDDGGILTVETVLFDVKSLTTDHKKRDKKMMTMFEPDEYPAITGSIQKWTLQPNRKDPLTLLLTIHGKQIEVPVTLTSYTRDENGIHFECEFELSLKACGLKRPSALGVIKVGDTVKLRVRSTLSTPKAP
jgi:hypothetical protein